MRINKFLAGAGLGSRRGVENLVTEGRVSVNGKICTNLAETIEADDVVMVDGVIVNFNQRKYYLAFNKPKGCVCTTSDDKGRKTVMDFLPENLKKIVKPVGRLDYNTEGLLIFTNDGNFANFVTSPKNEVEKHYTAKVLGVVTREEAQTLAKGGIKLDEHEKTAPCFVRLCGVEQKGDKQISTVEVIIHEGKNREVRKMFEAINHPVNFLKRSQIGALRLGGIKRGEFREFDPYIFEEFVSTVK